MIDWQFTTGGVLEYMRTMPEDLIDSVQRSMGVQILRLTKHVQGKLSGDVLKVRSGDLRAAVGRGSSVKRSATAITGTVGLDGASKEVSIAGAAQEFGADIPAHIVRSLDGKKLRFMLNGGYKFASVVMIPAVHIPMHSFLRSSLAELGPSMAQEINKAAQPALRFGL